MEKEMIMFDNKVLLLFARDYKKTKYYLVQPTKDETGWGEFEIATRGKDMPKSAIKNLGGFMNGLPKKGQELTIHEALSDFACVFENSPLACDKLEILFELIANYEKLRSFSKFLKKGGSGFSDMTSKKPIKDLKVVEQIDNVVIPSVLKDLYDLLEPRYSSKLERAVFEDNFGNVSYLIGEDEDGYSASIELPKKEGGSWGHIFVINHYGSSVKISTFPELFFNQTQETFNKFNDAFSKTTLRESEVWQLLELIQSYYTVKNYSMFAKTGRSGFTSLNSPLMNLGINIEESERIDNVVIPEIIKELENLLKGGK